MHCAVLFCNVLWLSVVYRDALSCFVPLRCQCTVWNPWSRAYSRLNSMHCLVLSCRVMWYSVLSCNVLSFTFPIWHELFAIEVGANAPNKTLNMRIRLSWITSSAWCTVLCCFVMCYSVLCVAVLFFSSLFCLVLVQQCTMQNLWSDCLSWAHTDVLNWHVLSCVVIFFIGLSFLVQFYKVFRFQYTGMSSRYDVRLEGLEN